MNSGILSGTFSLICLRFKLMQAGTEFAMESCSRLGFARGTAGSLRDPVDQGQGLAGRGHAFAGGTLGGRSLRLWGAGPVLLGLRASVVFLLRQILSALGLSTRNVVSNSHAVVCLSVTAGGTSLRTVATVAAATAPVATLGSGFIIQSILAGSSLAVRLPGSVHHARLLVIAAAPGASAAVSHALAHVGVGQLSLALQQRVRVTVRVPQH